jgi:hypothetical protein
LEPRVQIGPSCNQVAIMLAHIEDILAKSLKRRNFPYWSFGQKNPMLITLRKLVKAANGDCPLSALHKAIIVFLPVLLQSEPLL